MAENTITEKFIEIFEKTDDVVPGVNYVSRRENVTGETDDQVEAYARYLDAKTDSRTHGVRVVEITTKILKSF